MDFPTFDEYLKNLMIGWTGEYPEALVEVAKKSYEIVKTDFQEAWDEMRCQEDGYEGENDNLCPGCDRHVSVIEFKTDLGEGDVMVCEECYNKIEN